MRRLLTTTLVVTLTLSACGSPESTGDRPASSSGAARSGASTATAPATGDLGPAELTGTWGVDADREEPDTVLDLAPGALQLYRRCGNLSGSWQLDAGGGFVALVNGSSSRCARGKDPFSVPWLESAHDVRAEGSSLLLLDDSGRTLATLTRTPRPQRTDADAFRRYGPGRDSVAPVPPAAALPAGLREAGRTELLGTWLPVLRKGQPRPTLDDAWLQLDDDGTARGSDGCNGVGGSWRYRDGVLVTVSGGQTAIGCNNVDVGGWFALAHRAGFDGDTLVLVDAAGKELGRLREGRPRCGERNRCP